MELQTTNIWEITEFDDLIHNLKSSVDRFVIFIAVLNDTPLPQKISLKKFLKTKATKYPNILFLYYTIKNENDMRFSLLKKDKSEYPLAYFIWDTKEIACEFENAVADDIKIMFSKMKQVFIYDLHAKMNNRNLNDIENNNDNHINHSNHNETNVSENKHQQDSEQQKQQNKLISKYEKERLMDKLALLNEERDNYMNIEFIEDIKKRKRREEGKDKKKKNK